MDTLRGIRKDVPMDTLRGILRDIRKDVRRDTPRGMRKDVRRDTPFKGKRFPRIIIKPKLISISPRICTTKAPIT
jgi:hypothetical protein